jgi:hypothetical protein
VAGILAVVVCAPAVYVTFDSRLEGVTRAASAGVMYTADTTSAASAMLARLQIWEITNDQRIPAHAWDLLSESPLAVSVVARTWFLIAVPLAIAVVAVDRGIARAAPDSAIVLQHHD